MFRELIINLKRAIDSKNETAIKSAFKALYLVGIDKATGLYLIRLYEAKKGVYYGKNSI